jgi:hypothetical protein
MIDFSFYRQKKIRLPTPDSRLPTPDSRLPTPDSRLPTPDSPNTTLVEKPKDYKSRFFRLASHLIKLQNVYEDSFYDHYKIFQEWKPGDEQRAIDSIVQDIRFTGDYFTKNDDSQNKLITTGTYTGKKIFSVMTACTPEDLAKFFDYIIARPRLYAGKKWKLSEIFATWLSAGAPLVVKE